MIVGTVFPPTSVPGKSVLLADQHGRGGIVFPLFDGKGKSIPSLNPIVYGNLILFRLGRGVITFVC